MGVALSGSSSVGGIGRPQGSRGVAAVGRYSGRRPNHEPVRRYLDDSPGIFRERSILPGTPSLCEWPRTTFSLPFSTRIDRRLTVPRICALSVLAPAATDPISFNCHQFQSLP